MNNRRKWVAAAIETTKGTAMSLTAADAAILAYDPTMSPAFEMEGRSPSHMGGGELGKTVGPHIGEFSLRVELRGSGTGGTLPKWASTLLVASGLWEADALNSAGVYSPALSIDQQKTATVSIWEDGRKKTVYGAMCNAQIEAEYGKRGWITFNGRGIWAASVDEAAPSGITHETAKPPRFAAATFTVGGSAPKISNFSLDLGADVQLRPDHSQASALAHAYIAGERVPSVQFDPEALLVADRDIYGQFLSGQQLALALLLGSSAGNQVQIDAPKMQYTEVSSGERNGLLTDEATADLCASEVGGDELEVSFP